ncbi:MAG TPA: LuxR C-terminal-related transcriptional regulator [Candidatus Limnocylindrales bacterium]
MPGRVVSRRFIGREPDLARFDAAIAAAAAGTATAVVVAGTAGIGVSRFLDEGLARVAASRAAPLVLRGRAHGPADPPWQSVLDALAPLFAARPQGELEGLLRGDARPILADLPGLAALAAAVPAPAISALADPERRQPRALEALLRWLGRVAAERPIVLVLEDLHTADAATRALATFFARTAKLERIALVLSYQPDRLVRDHPFRENLAVIDAGLRPPVRIDLGPLARRDIAALIEGIEGERPSASIVVLVAERSAGSPLVVEELISARRELRNATLTGTLSDLVAARLARRAPECRRVLRLLATADRPVDRTQLERAAQAFEEQRAGHLPPRSATAPRHRGDSLDADLAAGLDEAVEYGLVRRSEDGRLHMRHELLRRAVVADLLPAQVPRYRTALARAFEDVPVVAAHHWLAAHRLAEARSAAVAAGRQAMRVEAPEDALVAFETALELPPPADPGPGDDPAELAQLAAEAAYASMRPLRAVAYAESARAALGERRDRMAWAVLEGRLGRYRLAAGDATGATTAFRRAAETVPPEASVERARILALLAQERMIAGAFADAERAADRALELARMLGDAAEPEAIHALTTLATIYGWGGRPEAAPDMLREAQRRAEALGLAEERWRATANLTSVLELLGRPSEAVDETFRGMAWAAEHDLDAVYGNLLAGNVAGVLVEIGRWAEARELSLRALDWSPAGIPFVAAILNLVIVEIDTEAGEEAGLLLGRILVELETGGDLQFAVPAYQATAAYAMWSGDLADARRAAERGWARLRGTEDWVLVARMASTALEVEAAIVADARDRRRIGDMAASRERSNRILAEAEAAVARVRAEGDALGSSEPEACLATARAFHARLMGRDDPANWADLAVRWNALGDPYREARARWRQAETILGGAIAGPGGNRDRTDARLVRVDAREPLAEAVRLATGLRARPLLRRLRDLAGRAMIPLSPDVDALLAEPAAPPSPVTAAVAAEPLADAPVTSAQALPHAAAAATHGQDTFGLSRRELEVLGLIAQGRTNREIGDRLFISQKTVGVHVGNILAKLGVSGRVEAASVAIRLGLETATAPARTR